MFSNCFHIRCFQKLSWRAYGNKLKATYGYVISCFHKLYQTVSQVIISVDKFKQANSNKP